MDITKLSEVEIKALVYDELRKLNVAQNNIKILEDQLAQREKNVKIENPPEVKDGDSNKNPQ